MAVRRRLRQSSCCDNMCGIRHKQVCMCTQKALFVFIWSSCIVSITCLFESSFFFCRFLIFAQSEISSNTHRFTACTRFNMSYLQNPTLGCLDIINSLELVSTLRANRSTKHRPNIPPKNNTNTIDIPHICHTCLFTPYSPH